MKQEYESEEGRSFNSGQSFYCAKYPGVVFELPDKLTPRAVNGLMMALCNFREKQCPDCPLDCPTRKLEAILEKRK